jgi:prepilin-type N-terminal cleavage/methylation domain-containing protein
MVSVTYSRAIHRTLLLASGRYAYVARTFPVNVSQLRASRGFSLIELMIAVAIVAILATIAYPSYSDYVMRGRIPEATTDGAGVSGQSDLCGYRIRWLERDIDV